MLYAPVPPRLATFGPLAAPRMHAQEEQRQRSTEKPVDFGPSMNAIVRVAACIRDAIRVGFHLSAHDSR